MLSEGDMFVFVGDIAFRFIKFVHNVKSASDSDTVGDSHVTVCDINQAMLDVGKRRAAALIDRQCQ